MKYKISQYAKLENVTYRTIWNRVKKGLLKTETTPNGHILVIVDENKNQRVAVYCRVSLLKTNLISKDRKKDFYLIAQQKDIRLIKSFAR